MKKTKYITLVIALIFTYTMSGQIVPPPIPPPPPPGLPIDGGMILLLLSGLFYGVKKVRE